MDSFFGAITQKLAAALAISFASLSCISCATQTATTSGAAAQTAVIYSAMIPVPSIIPTSTVEASSIVIVPDLLPSVKLPKFPKLAIANSSTSTIGKNTTSSGATETETAATTNSAAAPPTTASFIIPSLPKSTPSKTNLTNSAADTNTANTNETSNTSAADTSITAQSILDATNFSLSQNLDSSEELKFTANLGAAGTLSWGLLTTTIGGTGSIPEFDIATSCTPPPAAPSPSVIDQTDPVLNVRTSYDCTVAITPTSGDDRRTVSQDFTFTTDPGRIVASVAAETDNVLQNNTNNGGFTFDNQDSQPVTITGLVVDVSVNQVTTSSLLVLRFADPSTGASLYDLPLGNLPANPSTPGEETQTGISIPLSLTIPAGIQKMLPVEAIGVTIPQVSGNTPAITVTLRGVNVSESGINTKIVSPQIQWSCSVPSAGYDPYATSSAFLNGNACGE